VKNLGISALLTLSFALVAGALSCAGRTPAAATAARDIDCSRRPTTACCQAETPQCLECRRLQKERSDAWRKACADEIPTSRGRPKGVKPMYLKCDPAQPNMPCTPDAPIPRP